MYNGESKYQYFFYFIVSPFSKVPSTSSNVISLADEELKSKHVIFEKMKKEYKHSIAVESMYYKNHVIVHAS